MDIITAEILNKLMCEKYGPEWDTIAKEKEPESQFELDKRRFE